MKTISPASLQAILIDIPGTFVLDVRTAMEFAEVHVIQARNIPLDELRPEQLAIAKDRPVYVLCRGGHRAIKAAEKLAQGGYVEPVVVQAAHWRGSTPACQ